MTKDLFQTEFCLTFDDRDTIMNAVHTGEAEGVYCSACGMSTDIAGLRKHSDAPLKEAMCLPCFLHNFTDTDQDDIDRLVKIGEKQGLWS